MLIALTLEKSQLSKLLIALTQGCRSDTRKHQELTFSTCSLRSFPGTLRKNVALAQKSSKSFCRTVIFCGGVPEASVLSCMNT
jgi:hypothetical protein